jgi:flagellar hook-length control protein FliK
MSCEAILQGAPSADDYTHVTASSPTIELVPAPPLSTPSIGAENGPAPSGASACEEALQTPAASGSPQGGGSPGNAPPPTRFGELLEAQSARTAKSEGERSKSKGRHGDSHRPDQDGAPAVVSASPAGVIGAPPPAGTPGKAIASQSLPGGPQNTSIATSKAAATPGGPRPASGTTGADAPSVSVQGTPADRAQKLPASASAGGQSAAQQTQAARQQADGRGAATAKAPTPRLGAQPDPAAAQAQQHPSSPSLPGRPAAKQTTTPAQGHGGAPSGAGAPRGQATPQFPTARASTATLQRSGAAGRASADLNTQSAGFPSAPTIASSASASSGAHSAGGGGSPPSAPAPSPNLPDRPAPASGPGQGGDSAQIPARSNSNTSAAPTTSSSGPSGAASDATGQQQGILSLPGSGVAGAGDAAAAGRSLLPLGAGALGSALTHQIEYLRASVALAQRAGGAQARITLSPPALGELRIRLTQTQGGLIARVSADSGAGAALLSENQAELRSTLSSLGVVLLHLDIASGSFGQAAPGGAQRRVRSASTRVRVEPEEQQADAAAPPTQASALALHRGAVNVLA